MMLCKIADLIVEIPKAGDMVPRCREYLTASDQPVDIAYTPNSRNTDGLSVEDRNLAYYVESANCFYCNLLNFDGMALHASAVSFGGKAYLFSGPSGVGKSTHTRLWQSLFGEKVQVINDDKPALRLLGNRWYAYGTPWCGKEGLNQNCKVPLGGICFLKQGRTNQIRRLSAAEAVPLVYGQTYYQLRKRENAVRLLTTLDALVRMIPIYELQNRPERDAALLSWQTMCQEADKADL